MLFTYKVRASICDIAKTARDMGMYYAEDIDAITDMDDRDDVVSLGDYFDGLGSGDEYVDRYFEFRLDGATFHTFADRVGLEHCDDIDAYATDWTRVYNFWGDSFFAYEPYDYYYYCDECGEWYTREAFNVDYNMCNECARGRDIITPYHDHKGCYTYYGDDKRRIGVELEVDGAGGWYNANACAHEVDDILYEHAFYEEDSSLHDGFEIITHPHTVDEFFKLDWRGAFRVIKSHGMTSHDAGTCGLHIHFAREWFGADEDEQNDALIDLCNFYHKNYDTLFTLSRRDSDYWCSNDSSPIIDEYDLEDKQNDNDHGRAINLGNWYRIGTCEFRLGRGTLNFDTFAAWIDLHVAIVTQASRGATSYDWHEWINPDTVSARAWSYICDKLGTPEEVETLDLDAVADEVEKSEGLRIDIMDALDSLFIDIEEAGALLAGV